MNCTAQDIRNVRDIVINWTGELLSDLTDMQESGKLKNVDDVLDQICGTIGDLVFFLIVWKMMA